MVNYKDSSNNEIMEMLKDGNLTPELIKESVSRNSESINHFLNMLAKSNPEISEVYSQVYELPEKSDVLYYPNKDKFDFKNLPENIIIHIPENKKRVYKTLDNDEEFFLKIRIEKVKGSLLEFKAIEQNRGFKSYFDNSYVGSALALTASLSVAVMFSSHLDTQSKAAIPQGQMSVAAYSSNVPILNSYEEAIHELKKGNMNVNIEELTNHDVKLILSLTQENEEEVISLSKQDVVDSIAEVISPYVKEPALLNKIATSIYDASQERQVDYLLFLSIMKVETTTFNQNAVSSTGDVSIAQIKPEVWVEEFERLGKEPLDLKRLKKDASYAIDRMGEILEIQNKYKTKDPLWYARYHSKTPSKKLLYAQKVQKEYMKIKKEQVKEVEEKIDRILASLAKIEEPEGVSVQHLFVNYGKIDSFKMSLKNLKKIVTENKNKKIKQIVATL